ncbi:type I polyketide synthase [Saccharopolyspora phatthalungensis]|uniref:6-deoxyerythronolide-B synthase n=1 Tax=Saccharopolyspora phatthalungensis TaxID=664693 RepID=A0A840QE89_9PSEU|nr:type I polyketide synthase [Saccharopolyspora phatthalungensis]MBB5158746.1 pimaricinolide synthase PimS1 [Saccharopolyspora phatthalungensis]
MSVWSEDCAVPASRGPAHPSEGDIAVVGLSCRFPGADGPTALWSLLTSGATVDSPVPEGRWDRSLLDALSPDEASIIRQGAFLGDVAGFDAAFFGISPHEAAMMDPQQRLLLELGWEALEDAGIPGKSVAGSALGVFVGVAGDDYGMLIRERGPDSITPHTFTGSLRGIVANRVSYFLRANGPSLVVDAGQASSLVAVHVAAESLRRGDCAVAIAGGVALRLAPHHSIAAHRFGALSPDGRCHVFDARANGFGQGEGGGAVVLKPLASAIADGDEVYCVFRGSAVNNDGGGDQLSTPTQRAQAEVIRAAHRRARTDPGNVAYVELHGTGTSVGDPVEAAALGEAIGAAGGPASPLRVGSIKSNIGHLEAAAGIAGFIKTALCIRAGILVPTAGFGTPNPQIPLRELNLRVQSTVEPVADRSALFGVSSFGVGGTNCHVVLSAPPLSASRQAPETSTKAPVVADSDATPVPLVLSGASAAALRAQATRLAPALDDNSPVDVGWSLVTSRSGLAHRAVVLGADRTATGAAPAGLSALAAGEPAELVRSGRATGHRVGVFVFPGQGSQWVGMAAGLLDSSPVFAESIHRCEQALAPFVDWTLTEVLRGAGAAAELDRVDVVQPALWAVMIGLADVWQALGVRPAAVVGHSQGEIAAACVAGILGLDDGARIVALRSQIIAEHLAGKGGMASVALPADALREILVDHPEISVAALNGPRSTVVSGASDPLERLLKVLENRNIRVRVRRVPVDYASHSPHVDAIEDDLRRALAPITPPVGEIAFHSTVTGTPVSGTELTPDYWFRNLRNTVLFHPTIESLIRDSTAFIEPSPHPVLTVRIEETAQESGIPAGVIGTLHRGDGTLTRLLASAGEAWIHGLPVDWTAVFGGSGARRIPLPSYPFQRTRHWFDGVSEQSDEDLTALELKLRETGSEGMPDVLFDLVRRHTAVALGYGDPAQVSAEVTFRDQGLTSAVGAGMCAELAKATGVALPPTAVFDHPTPTALARHLEQQLRGGARTTAATVRGSSVVGGDDPVAIVGMACRYPGEVASPEDLWQLVADHRDVIGDFPADRGWDLDRLLGGGPDGSVARGGGFLHGIAGFDAEFFGISPREALAMDPQQRHLLEIAWEAVERAAINPQQLRGSDTGVFVGLMAQDYGPRLHEPADGTDGYRLTGSTTSVASGRISYLLGLEGPAVTVDTACSSSLVALHLAAQALRNGECSLALAGGATIMSTPGILTEFSRQGGLSVDGRCKAFSSMADGTGWGEGVGIVVLERLSDARRNGHPVQAIVRGSAINQDGASNGLTAPHGPSQQRVIRQALTNAGLTPSEVDAVEAHGTGTRLGDPIEAQALLATYGQDREIPLWLGSVKSNIGHTQAAAGIAGVIKMVQAMRHGTLPSTLHIDEPTPYVDWSSGAVALLTEDQQWPDTGRPRRAAISSFGISGTNAHLILEQPPRPPVEAAPPSAGPRICADSSVAESAVPWLLSAHSETAMRAQAERLQSRLSADPVEVAMALATTRPEFDYRAAVFGPDRAGALAALSAGRQVDGLVRGVAEPVDKVVFVYPGQGAQWIGMGATLLDTAPAFAKAIHDCEQALNPHVDWSLTHILRDTTNPTHLDRVDILQPALWAIMIALTKLWATLGITPDAVIGHSQGEIAAACVAGILTLEDAARITALRSKLIAEHLAGHGGMATIAQPADTLHDLLADHPHISIAALNSPHSTVISGPTEPLERLLTMLEQRGIRTRRIPVDYASHSTQVDTIKNELRQALQPISPRHGTIPFHSTVTTTPLPGTHLTPDYWHQNLRNTVQFHPTVEKLVFPRTTFIEPSPHPVLTLPIQEINDTANTIATLHRDKDTLTHFLTNAATAWTQGLPTAWTALHPTPPPHTPLPTYPFQHTHYWPEKPDKAIEQSDDFGFWNAVETQDTAAFADVLGLPSRENPSHENPSRENPSGENAAEPGPSWLDEALPAMAQWRRRNRESTALRALRYAVEWKPLTTLGTSTPTGSWLVVLPESRRETPWARALPKALRASGSEVTELWLDTDSESDRHILGARLQDMDGINGIVSLLAFDDAPQPESPALPRCLAAKLALIQALADVDLKVPLWNVTCGAVGVGRSDAPRRPVQNQIWGFGRVVALEQPERWGGLIDVAEEPDQRSLSRLLAALAQSVEDQVAIRASGTFARRVLPASSPPVARTSCPPRGTVLITGGTGALGAQVARRLAQDGAAHLVLASLRGPDAPGAEALADELRSLGSQVSIVACDIGDRAAVAALLAGLPDAVPLTTVIHAAGTLDDAVIDALTPAQLDRVLRVKAEGARHLHELTLDLDLDDFVLFSSISGVLGIPGQGNYAPGNAYLDALAEHRRALGLPATAYAWGPWAGDGMAGASVADRLRRHGVPTLSPDQALTILSGGSAEPRAAVMVADIRWERFFLAYSEARRRPLIEDLPQVRALIDAGAGGRTKADDQPLTDRLRSMPPQRRSATLLDLVRTQVAAVLGHADAHGIDTERPFQATGFDSLTGVELRNRLSAEVGVRLPSSLVFDHPTPGAVARFLEAELVGSEVADEHSTVTASGAEEPVVIVGMACRYPGQVTSPEELWRLVSAGGDAIGDFPADRGWDPERLAASVTRRGGFLHDMAGFDAGFFGISPREALAMDPQQRLLLETSWETFERSGIDPHSLRGTDTGVFVGLSYQDYQSRVVDTAPELEGYLLTGTTASVASGRVAYTFGLEGPAVTVDTACSSSLVALHLAAEAVRRGECSMALAGGVALMATPHMFIEFSRQGGLSPDGRCKAFSSDADGFGSGEGVGLLLVERLSDARRNGHPVLAIVRGSAVNQDGASNGLTAPHGPSQQRVIRQALANAGLSPSEVDAVEAHGTGTRLGDPIEAQALLATYGHDRENSLWLGSVKSNIGHTQAAAGIASVIKMTLAMQHGILPQTLHITEPTPEVDWGSGAVALLTENRQWPETGRPRRAAISSFGISGTNAHLILEQPSQPAAEAAPQDTETLDAPADEPVVPWVLSAKSPEALRAQASRLAEHVTDEHSIHDVAYSLATTRAVLDHRAVVLGHTRDELRARLTELAHGTDPIEAAGPVDKVVFVYPGQGAQWIGMGAQLLDTAPAFAKAIHDCEHALNPHVDWSLTHILRDTTNPTHLDRVDILQPTLWAIMIALTKLWATLGITPDAVIGHSQGEIAAACVAGILTLQDAARITALRSKLIAHHLAGKGGMASVALPADALHDLLADHPHISIAALNSPHSTVISGPTEPLNTLLTTLENNNIHIHRIPVDYASHSAHVDTIHTALRHALQPITPQPATIPFHSTVTGTLASGSELTPDYWYRNLRDTVQFHPTIHTLHTPHTIYLEPSPHPVLTHPIQQTTDTTHTIPTLHRDNDTLTHFLTNAATAWTHGLPTTWTTPHTTPPPHTALPTYPFQHTHYWPKARVGGALDLAAAGQNALRHPLLTACVPLADGGVLCTGRISLETDPWLADHVVAGVVLLPGTAFVEMAVRAGDEVDCDVVEDLTLTAPLPLPDEGGIHVQVHLVPEGTGSYALNIHARPENALDSDPWTSHATGTLTRARAEDSVADAPWPPIGAAPLPLDELYDRLAGHGYAYGPTFQGLRVAWASADEVFAEVVLPEEARADAKQFSLHPALLDAASQTVLLPMLSRGEAPSVLPFAWRNFTVHATGADTVRVHLSAQHRLVITDPADALVAEAEALSLRPVDLTAIARAGGRDGLFRIEWSEFTPQSGLRADAHVDVASAADLPVLAAANVPPLVFARLDRQRDDYETPSAAAAHAETQHALGLLQAWLAEPRFSDSRLVLVTRGAVQVADAVPAHTRHAAVWGLVRSAQTENPGRFVLVDVDGTDDSYRMLPVAVADGEPQIALRAGRALLPRLVRVDAPQVPAPRFDPDGTVLLTGGSGTLGGLLARHLVAQHGVRRLLLVSRQGPQAEGTDQLLAELRAAGAQVEAVACDVADRRELKTLLEQVPSTHPLTAVIHAAGVLADGVVESLTPELVDEVCKPKIDAAVNLHELTDDLDAFVLFSSAAGVVGSAGQANYAAANSFLDALARYRRHRGSPAVSLAWGLWSERSALTGDLDETALHRLSSLGIGALPTESALALFDAAFAGAEAAVVPLRLDTTALVAGTSPVPPLLRDLVRAPVRRSAAREKTHLLDDIPADRRPAVLLDLVRERAAGVLGLASSEAVSATRAFRELGFDSLAAVELRNRLNLATGLRLPATLVFDQPNPTALARYLDEQLSGMSRAGASAPAAAPIDDDPVVIVGMACRYPGGSDSPDALWRLVENAGDAVAHLPTDRGWDITAEGAFLYDAAEFDADFFGISPREALAMDPQQRLLLETSWEAFERAGFDVTSLRGSRTGVFAGVMYHDYGARLTNVPPDVEGYLVNGSAGSVVSGRVAYSFGLEGPAVTVDTACSSSLVALHLAAQALRNGECSLALAGGVTVMATPAPFVEFSRQGGLSADGRCKAFSSTADGTGWGEGVGIVVLERLSDAHRNRHPVLAVVRGSAINQDGASNGLTAPNGPSQQRVIRQALTNAGLTPSEVDAVEAHGTGTRLGDPIEAQALLATYGQDRQAPLWLGSIKSNIGHTQAAAGIAGIIKMTLAMQHGTLPQTLHIDQPTPEVDWKSGAVALLTENRRWPDTGRPRRAAVSSFGVSGTNAHVILEQAPDTPPAEPHAAVPVVPWVLSAKTPEALRAQAAQLADHLTDETSVPDIGYSLATTRAAFEERAVVVAGDLDERAQALAALAQGVSNPDVITGRAAENSLAMVFSGQGSQRHRMGHQLYETYPAFADAFDTACTAIDPHLPRPLRDAVFGEDPELINQTQYAQPALFAFQVALYRLWEYWGIRPSVLAGHSIGEITAAHIAGLLSLPDAATMICTRGRLMQSLPDHGAMAAVAAAENDVLPHLTGHEHEVGVAAINSPTSLVLSGNRTTLNEITRSLQENGYRVTELRVSHAFHSPLIQPILAQFREALAGLRFQAPALPLVSTRTGRLIDNDTLSDPDHWIHHARHTVQFARAVTTLGQHATTYLEIGPAATLTPHLPNTAIPSLHHNQPEPQALNTALATLLTHGLEPNWHNYFTHTGAHTTELPTYPFQRKRYWLDDQPTDADLNTAGLDPVHHPLLKASVASPSSDGVLLAGRVSLRTHPWLADHAAFGSVLLPGTAFVELALHAGSQSGHPHLAELTIDTPLVLPEDGAVQLRVEAGESDAGRRLLGVYSRPEGAEEPWTRHGTGVLTTGSDRVPAELTQWPPKDAESIDVEGLYRRLVESGVAYGSGFRGLRAAWARGDEIYAEVRVDDTTEGFHLHPALFDAALHASAGGDSPSLPFSWTGVTVHRAGVDELRVRLVRRGSGEFSLDLADSSGAPVATVDSLVGRPVTSDQLHQARSAPSFLLDWQPFEPQTEIGDQQWAVVGGAADVPADVAGLRVTVHGDIDEALTAAPSDAIVLTDAVEPAVNGDLARAARTTAERVLAALQKWLADKGSTRLVILTRGATDSTEDHPRLPGAAVWGLVRSAQLEHPGRLVLVDTDGHPDSWPALPAAVRSGEPQIALRAGQMHVPRLVATTAGDAEVSWGPGTVLLTGASGALGGVFARHLVESCGVRRLLLVSRRGADAPGAADLEARLHELGAVVDFAACDVSDRRALSKVIASVPPQWPLSAVVHCAGALDDAALTAQSGDRLAAVFAPKADAACHLHELTKDMDLSAFVLFSSAAGVLGAAGQANYAAANAFVDALAEVRRAAGLPAVSLAWGLWDADGGMAGRLGQTDRRRLARIGITPLDESRGRAMFDEALATGEPVVAPLILNKAALRSASRESVPAVLHGFVPVPNTAPRSPSQASAPLQDRLDGLDGAQRRAVLLDVVRTEVAGTLGHASAAALDPHRSFAELGFDSLTAVELRNRLAALSGLALPANLAFDHPSPDALAAHLDAALPGAPGSLLDELDRLEAALTAVEGQVSSDHEQVARRLADLLAGWKRRGGANQAGPTAADTTTPEELMSFIDQNL